MASETPYRRLAEAIRRILQDGLTLEPQVLHYIDSTFADPGIGELEAILSADGGGEAESLLELLFFPDEAMQVQLEPLLEELGLQARDLEAVVAELVREPMAVVLRFPDKRGVLNLELPLAHARQLVSRLNIHKHLPQRLREAIRMGVAPDLRDPVKVRIRNAHWQPTGVRVDFLCRLVTSEDLRGEDFLDCLDFALGWLEELQNGQDPFDALMDKKKFYFLSLQVARQQEEYLQKYNTETLLLQGRRIAAIDKDEVRQEMFLIDRISRAVFGKTQYFEPGMAVDVRLEGKQYHAE